ncbi:hypothetical protein MMAG44476_21737 [Mycolicibacterium mageritense DSM 44476 = CIP 104973]|jgi:hypothetical protein|uniref:Uncharacterized protein n=1 Tax=Mycolicibacterium canariasense TaxID=228230 RepID=A0A100WBC9_MYCCR|nr:MULTISPECIES: hypothetical protein [Mycolicibacterium]MCC9186363.1 hypothetical protein [Mycolicibacterium mageritense]MCV7211425.1 hypothetical protein [Mycolicibacterium canariasense]ORV10461.1 hypothetical protein AWB94_07100 [Mycolicibacterium canariasense]GAS94914.1 uncharacterized protein RMCC_1880 [Mycolicibacterium canariasense]
MVADDDHAAIWALESAACQASAWERWIDQVEALLGHSPDGDLRADRYSLDSFYAHWKAGVTPSDAVAAIGNAPI